MRDITKEFYKWSKKAKIYNEIEKFQNLFTVHLEDGIVWVMGDVPECVHRAVKQFAKENKYKYWALEEVLLCVV